MRIPCLYIESTMFNFYFYGKGKEKQTYTRRLFDAIEAGTYRAATSEYVVRELLKDVTDKRQEMLDLIKTYKIPVLPLANEIKDMAMEYISRGIIPQKYADDAYHIAVSARNGLDFVVSYNYNHIVKLKTIIGTGLVNRRFGLPIVGLSTPKEMLEYGT